MDGQKIGAAKALAEMVLGSPKCFSDWAMIMPLLGSSEECEAFRVALLLQGQAPQRNAWFVFDRDDPRSYDGTLPEPSFRLLDRLDARQPDLNLEPET